MLLLSITSNSQCGNNTASKFTLLSQLYIQN